MRYVDRSDVRPQNPALQRRKKRRKRYRYNKKRVYGALAGLLLICVAFVFLILFMGKEKVTQELRLVDAKEKEYLLLNADAHISFSIKGGQEPPQYKLTDLKGKTLSPEIETKGKKITLKPPDGAYTPGDIYIITLKKDSSFTNKKYKDAKILNFKIYREQVAKATFTDQVKVLSQKDVTLREKSLEMAGTCTSGSVIVVEKGAGKPAEACKVAGNIPVGGKTIARVVSPDIDEVYSHLDINKTFISDAKYLKIDKNALLITAQKQGILDAFLEEAQALTAEDIETTVEQKDDNTIKATVRIIDPADQNRVLSLTFTISYRAQIDLNDQFQFIDNKIQLTGKTKLSVSGEETQEVQSQIEEAIVAFEKENKTSLGELPSERASGFVPVFRIEIPIYSTMFFSSDCGVQYDLLGAGQIVDTLTTDIKANHGILIQRGKIKKQYANVSGDVKGPLHLAGRMNGKISPVCEMKVGIAGDSAVSFTLEPEIYRDMKGLLITKNIADFTDAKGYYDLEVGLLASDRISAELSYIDSKYNLNHKTTLLKQKTPALAASNVIKDQKVNLKKRYAYKKGKVHPGQLKVTYRDILEGKKNSKPLEKYQLFVDGKRVKVKNGTIQSKVSLGKHTFLVCWDYRGQKMKYKQKVTILKSFPLEVVTGLSYKDKFGPFKKRGVGKYYSTVNIALPRVKSSTESAKKCNKIINGYCGIGKDMAYALADNTPLPANYESIEMFSSYEWSYQVYRYKDITALILSNSVRGNNWGGWKTHYALYYDNSTGKVISPAKYAKAAGYDSMQVIKLAEKGAKNNDRLYVPYSLDDFADKGTTFYVDENGSLHIEYGYSE